MPVEVVRRKRVGARGGDAARLAVVIQHVLKEEGAGHREVSVLLTDDQEIQELNRGFRGKDKPTDVLAFGLDEAEGADVTLGPLGDVVISVERARIQAEGRGKDLDSELELLAVHGTLHLLGFDHQEPADAKKMQARTRALRRQLKPKAALVGAQRRSTTRGRSVAGQVDAPRTKARPARRRR